MFKTTFWLILALTLLTACDLVTSTGDSAADPEAAQRFLPQIVGYDATSADNIIDALTAAGGSASLITGNLPVTALVAKLDTMIQCYQDVGAVSANIYTEQIDLLNPKVPILAVLAVVNQERLQNNLLACALGSADTREFSAQAVEIQPCVGSGEFKINDETLSYIYAATDQLLCSAFETHFNSIRANQGTG